MTRRTRAERERAHADLLEALGLVLDDARPRISDRGDVLVDVSDVIAAAHGTTVEEVSDTAWAPMWRQGWKDLLELQRQGLVVLTWDRPVTWAQITRPGGHITSVREQRADREDLRRQFSSWQPAD